MDYILVGTFDKDLKNGVDSYTFIFGVYRDPDYARQALFDLQSKQDRFEGIPEADCWDVKEGFVRYCDFAYSVIPFTGTPVICAQTWYFE